MRKCDGKYVNEIQAFRRAVSCSERYENVLKFQLIRMQKGVLCYVHKKQCQNTTS